MGRDHRNPNARKPQQSVTGNERRGNKDAAEQARQNLKRTGKQITDIVKSVSNISKSVTKTPVTVTNGRTNTPTVSFQLPSQKQSNVTSRGNDLIRTFGKPQVDKNQAKAFQYQFQAKGNKSHPLFDRLFKGFDNAKPYSFNPYEQEKKDKETWEHLNDKEFNATPDRQGLLKVLQNYSGSGAVVEYATKNLQHTDYWFTATDFFGDAVLGQITKASHPGNHFPNYLHDYLGDDFDIKTQADYDAYLKRFEIVQKWFDKNTHSSRSYDPTKEAEDGFRDPFSYTTVINSDAPLPPWVENTPENQERWATYLSRSDYELQTINTQGEHYHNMLKQQGLDNVELKEKGYSGKVGNSSEEFMDAYENGSEGAVNSFSDVFAKSLQRQRQGKTFLDTRSLEDSTFGDFKNYIRDYWVNPIRTGRWGTFLANRLFGLMDVVDMPAKGVRAAMAAQPHVLYDGHKIINGQDAFVYSGGKDLQKKIMENGGAELLYSTYDLAQGYNPNTPGAEKYKQQLIDAGLWDEFQNLAKEWHGYKSDVSVIDNIIDAYTNPGRDYYTNTGNMGKDIALDMLLDPTLIAGGLARGAGKQAALGSVKAASVAQQTAEAVFENSVRQTIGASTKIGSLSSFGSRDRDLIEKFITNNKNILFKNSDDISREVDIVADRLARSDSNSFINEVNVETFKTLLKKNLNDSITRMNSSIVSYSPVGMTKADKAITNSLITIGNAADKLDSILLKTALPEIPFLQGSVAGTKRLFSKRYNSLRMKRHNVALELFGANFKGVSNITVDQLEHFEKVRGTVDVDPSTLARFDAAGSSKLKMMEGRCDRFLHRVNSGTISPEEALGKIRNEIQLFVGKEECTSLDQLEVILRNKLGKGNLPVNLDEAYNAFVDAYRRLEDCVTLKNKNAADELLKDISSADTIDKLFNIFKRYNDYLNYHDPDLLDKIVAKLNPEISTEDLDKLLKEVDLIPRNEFKVNRTVFDEADIDKAVDHMVVHDTVASVDSTPRASRVIKKALKEEIEKRPGLKACLKDKNIIGLERLRKALEHHADDYRFSHDDLMKTIDNTFWDVQLKYKGNPPIELTVALEDLRDVRGAFQHKIGDIRSNQSGAVYRYQVDRMVMFDQLTNSDSFLELFDFYDDNIFPLLTEIKEMDLSCVDSVNHLGFYQQLSGLRKDMDAINLFHRLNSKLDLYVNDQQKYAILDYMFGISTQTNETVIKKIASDTSKLNFGIDNSIYSTFGESKIGIKNARVRISDYNDSIWGKYRDEILGDTELQDWVRNLIDKTNDDPINYINLQILQNVLVDPDAIKYYNAKNLEHPVVFFHCSTTGLRPTNSDITGIGYKQWVNLPENASLRELFEKIINVNNEKNSIRIAMDEDYLSNTSSELLNKIYDTHAALDMATDKVKLDAYMKCFGVKEGGEIINEEEVVKRFCKVIDDLSYVDKNGKRVKGGIPCLVCHDFEGFNMPFFKSKIAAFADNGRVEIANVARDLNNYERFSENSFDTLKVLVNDQTLTASEKDAVRACLTETAQEMGRLGKYFRFADLTSISNRFEDLQKYALRGYLKDTNDSVLKQINNVFQDTESIQPLLDGVHEDCRRLKELSDYAGERLLIKNSASPKVVDSFLQIDEVDYIEKTNKSTIRAMDRISDLYGISSAQMDIPAHYNAVTKQISTLTRPLTLGSTGEEIVGYGNPAKIFLHEFGHFIVRDHPEFKSYFNDELFNKKFLMQMDEDLYEYYLTLEKEHIHKGYGNVKEVVYFEEMFVEGLAHWLRDPDNLRELRWRYPLDQNFHDVLDNVSTVADAHTISDLASPTFENVKYYDRLKMQKEFIPNLFKDSPEAYSAFVDRLAKVLHDSVIDANDPLRRKMGELISTTTNAVRHSNETLSIPRMLNIRAKYDLNNIRSFFIGTETTDYSGISFELFEHMSDYADYVSRTKEYLSADAEELLSGYRNELLDMLAAMKVYGASQNNDLRFLALLKPNLTDEVIPLSNSDLFLLCKKFYDDILKYYIDKRLVGEYERGISKGYVDRSKYRQRLLLDFVYGASAPNLDNFSDPKILKLLDGGLDYNLFGFRIDTRSFDSAGLGSDGLLKALEYSRQYNRVKENLSEVLNLDASMNKAGFINSTDHKEAILYKHVADFVKEINVSDGKVFDTLSYIQKYREEFAEFYRFRKLMTDGAFDKDKIINELLWNDHNMIVLYPNKFNADIEKDFREFVQQLDEKYIECNEEGGAFFVYIKDGFDVQENLSEHYRYISGHPYMRSVRNEYEAIPFPKYADLDEGISEKAYDALQKIYRDMDYLSDGASKGTTGRLLSFSDYDSFFKKIPDTYSRMCKPRAMLQQDMYRGLVCDPGFIKKESDIFDDILGTFENLKRSSGDFKLAAHLVFNESDSAVSELFKGVTNDEVIRYFNEIEDYVIAELTPGKTESGMMIRQIKPRTNADVEYLRQSNAVVIPYQLLREFQEHINYKEVNSVMAVFNKALVLYKACQLCSPGTWYRNYIDAITKAVLEEKAGVQGAVAMAGYGFKSDKEVSAVMLMLQREEAYISERTWESLCRRYHIEGMTWDDYQLLLGLLDKDRMSGSVAQAYKKRDNAIISGDSISIRELSDEDVKKYWYQGKLEDDPSVFIDIDTFNAIRSGALVADGSLYKEYEFTVRKLLTSVADQTRSKFDKAIDRIFWGFNKGEVTARYAQLLWLRDLGYSKNQSIKKLDKTQFYGLPNASVLSKLEMVVPFATFKYNNALFWIRMIDENPSYYRLLEHIYGPIAHDNYNDMVEKYGEYDISNDYMLKTGGIPIGGSGLYFRLSPSCLDFFKIFYGGLPSNVQGLNPWLRFGFKYSMYGLGLNSSEFLSEMNYNYSMEDFVEDAAHLLPAFDRMYDIYQHFHDKSFLYENAPNLTSQFLVKYFSSFFGSRIDFDSRSYDSFEAYQMALAKDGLWFDCNKGEVVPLSEKNELGANDPRLNWDDISYFMMLHFGKVWDSNVGHFVKLADYIPGGLNQEFDLENDPEAWDKLCEEYKKIGKVFDYNTGHFVLEKDLSSGGLNDPNLSFDERTRLYWERFHKRWDANQNKYTDSNHYIPGGLNDINGIKNYHDWNLLKSYRRALYGEVYERFDQPDADGRKGHFVKKYQPTCVTLESLLLKSANDNDYYQYVAVPSMASVAIKNCTIKDGYIRTKDGKYVLTWNQDYNNKVLEKFYMGSGFSYRRHSWGHRNWKNYQKTTSRRFYDPNQYRGVYTGERDYENFYRYQFSSHGHFYGLHKAHRIHRTNSGRVVPYGGTYTKFSFYTR